MKTCNCMTYALQIEDMDISILDLNLWYHQSQNPEDVIREKLKEFNRSCRSLANQNSPLEKGEWLIAFFGFIPYHFDYEGRPDAYDYHFIKWDDNQWKHRKCIKADITPISDDVINEFIKKGYNPKFFAVKTVEDI
mgnify:CR=1 FL=1